MTTNDSISDKEFAEDLAFFAEELAYIETHDIGDELKTMPEVKFEVSPRLHRKRYALNYELSDKLGDIARQRGVSAETLLNQWVREKTAEVLTVGAAE